MSSLSDLTAALSSMGTKILAKINAHANSTSNPHSTSASQVGAYTTSQTDTLVGAVSAALSTHSNNTSNPHGTTAAQVGAYTKAQSDTNDAAVASAASSALTSHTGNTSNPHSTTAAQVGAYTTGQTDSLVAAVTSALNTHANNTNNPHAVTPSQIGAASPTAVQSWSKGQSGAISALTDPATGTIDIDLSKGNNFSITLTGNRTLNLPTNIAPGQSGAITVTQDATGSRTLAYNSVFKFASGTAPTLSTAASAVDVLCYYVVSATQILLSCVNNVK